MTYKMTEYDDARGGLQPPVTQQVMMDNTRRRRKAAVWGAMGPIRTHDEWDLFSLCSFDCCVLNS